MSAWVHRQARRSPPRRQRGHCRVAALSSAPCPVDPASFRSAVGGLLAPAPTLASPDSSHDVHPVHPTSYSPRRTRVSESSPPLRAGVSHAPNRLPVRSHRKRRRGCGSTRRRGRNGKCSSWGTILLLTTDREAGHKCEEGAFASRVAISWLRKVSCCDRWSQRRRRGPLSTRSTATQDDTFKGLPNLSQPNTARDLRPLAQGVEIHDGSQHSLDI